MSDGMRDAKRTGSRREGCVFYRITLPTYYCYHIYEYINKTKNGIAFGIRVC